MTKTIQAILLPTMVVFAMSSFQCSSKHGGDSHNGAGQVEGDPEGTTRVYGLEKGTEIITLREWNPEFAQVWETWLKTGEVPQQGTDLDKPVRKVEQTADTIITENIQDDVVLFRITENSVEHYSIWEVDRNKDGIFDEVSHIQKSGRGEIRTISYDDDFDGFFERIVIMDTSPGPLDGTITVQKYRQSQGIKILVEEETVPFHGVFYSLRESNTDAR